MESDYAEQERVCGECPTDECQRDEFGYCEQCKLRALEARFPLEFREWVNNLTRLYLWRNAGYPLRADELDFEQWQALAVITRFYQVKDLEAQVAATGRS